MMEVVQRSHFRVAPYQYYARTGSGHTPSRGNDEYWIDCDVPWVTTADVKHLRDGRTQVVNDTEHQISRLGLANSAARLHPAGTVVLSRTASVGFSAIMGVSMATSQDFVTWSPGSELDSRFFLWVLRAMKGTGDFDSLMYGSTHKTIYVPDLQQLRGPLPPLEMQRRIADYLDTETVRIDTLITRTDQAVSLVQERLRRQRHRVLWGRLSSPLHASAGLSRVQYVTQRRVAGKTPRRGEERYWTSAGDPEGFKWAAIGDLTAAREGTIVDTAERVTVAAVEELLLPIAPRGAVLYAMYASLGEVMKCGEPMAHNQAIIALHPGPGISTEYLYEWLRFLRPYVLSEARSNTQANLNAEQVGRLPVPFPPRAQQDRRVAALQDAEQRANRISSALARQRELLLERKLALVTAAVTGELKF